MYGPDPFENFKSIKRQQIGSDKNDWHQFHFSSRLCHNHSYQYPKLPIIGLTYYESYQTGTFHNVVQSTDQLGNVPQCGATRSLPRQLWHGSPCPGCSGRGHPEPSFKAFLNHCAITLCPDSPGMGHPSHSFPEWWNQTTQANQGSLQGPTRKLNCTTWWNFLV